MCFDELSLHVLDIAQYSVRAGARMIGISVTADSKKDILSVEINDDGTGMTKEQLELAGKREFSTKGTQGAGRGLLILAQAAKKAEGGLQIASDKGRGTKVKAWFKLSHRERKPMGDLAQTVLCLLRTREKSEIIFKYDADGRSFFLDTRELEESDLKEPETLSWIKSFLWENINEANQGLEI